LLSSKAIIKNLGSIRSISTDKNQSEKSEKSKIRYFDTFKWSSKQSETTFLAQNSKSKIVVSKYTLRAHSLTKVLANKKAILNFEFLPREALWYKNGYNRRDRKSHTWAPLNS
jgi:hypothetical protein